MQLAPDLLEVERDPDVVAAVETYTPAVIEIRTRSARLVHPFITADQRTAEQSAIDGLVADMTSRAERIGITVDQLFAEINAELAGRRDGDPSRPHGPLLEALLEEVGAAHGAEARLHREITSLQAQLPRAVGRRIAADRACAGYVAGWPARGRRS